MTFGTKKYHLVSRVKDRRRFSIDNLEHYSLSLQAGYADFQVCVTDTRNDVCLLLEDYTLQDIDSEESYLNTIRTIFDDHHCITANFWNSVVFSVKNSKFSIAPALYFSENSVSDLLKYNVRLSPEKEIYRYSEIKDINAVSAFAVDKKLVELMDSIYLNVKCQWVHQSSAFIHSVLAQGNHEKQIFGFLDRESLHISIINGSDLLFYNQFPLNRPADMVRYMLVAGQSLELDFQSTPVRLWGLFDKNSNHLQDMARYARRVRLGTNPSFLKFSYEFDEIPEHRYFDVYGIYLCVKHE